MTKILSGRELAGFVKERQAGQVRSVVAEFGRAPHLVIVRDSDNPVICKYVELKCRYGEDIDIKVTDLCVKPEELLETVQRLNEDDAVDAVIVQLPIMDMTQTDAVVAAIVPEKDVDNLSGQSVFDSATAEAINWLLAGYDVRLDDKRIALVGRGRLVGAPLEKMWRESGYDVTTFGRGDDLSALVDYDVIVTATGQAHLIDNSLVGAGAVIVDAGTASEGGVLVGDVADEVRERGDIAAITPRVGGVGPLTVSVLFDHVIRTIQNAK